jgi:hypothetical protein
MATFAECLAALPSFRNDLLRRQHLEEPSGAATARAYFETRGAYAAFATPLTNIHATGVGIRHRGGQYDPSEHVLKVFVFDKLERDVPAIPTAVRNDTDVPIDVEHMPIQVVRATRRRAGARRRGGVTAAPAPIAATGLAAAAVRTAAAEAINALGAVERKKCQYRKLF